MRMTLLGGLLGAALAVPAFADDVSVQTATGAVTVPAKPGKIAVFDVAAVDTINALGQKIDGVPNKLYVKRLDPVMEAGAVVGTLFEPDFEALAVMQPDLIVAGGRSSEQVENLSQIAPTIDMTIWGDDMLDQAHARIAAYGAIFDVEDKAAALTEELNAKLAEAQRAVKGKGKALILLTNGSKVSAYGRGGRFGWLHSEIGIEEAAQNVEAETHGEAVSFEFVADINPDWLLVVDRGAAIGADSQAAEATLDNPLIAKTTAAQKGQIVYLDAASLYIASGGAGSVLHTLDEVIAAFAGADS